jgi:biofilm PGA synthesis lipoprotein PgaB
MRWLTLLVVFLALPVRAAGLDYQVIAYHDVRDDVAGDYDPDQFAVSTGHLIAHFRWLRDAGFQPVSVDQILAAEAGGEALPENAVLLTFDDGLRSFYTRVYPLLRLFDYPAVVSVVTSWIEMDGSVPYAGKVRDGDDFLTWDQIREMQASGLVEIGSHTHDHHKGVQGNPQGNLQTAVVTRRYDGERYEDEARYRGRVAVDLARSIAMITAQTGQRPRVITWPFGAFNDAAADIAYKLGMRLSLTLEPGNSYYRELPHRGRFLITANPTLADLSAEVLLAERPPVLRVAQVDLDYLFDPDPLQQASNLDRLLDRIKGLDISHVFLQAYADPDGDGSVDAVYFPNRHLPVRADLFNRVAWQLKTRADVRVYAWMPMLSFAGGPFREEWRVRAWTEEDPASEPVAEPRLSPFHAQAVARIAEIYEDLATYAKFDGLLFHDDGRLNEHEDFSDAAMAEYGRTLGRVPTPDVLAADPALRRQFSRLKTQSLIDLSTLLTERVRRHLPAIRTARNLFATALLDSEAPEYLAQDFDAFLDAYDYVALLAMPELEGIDDSRQFFVDLVSEVAARKTGYGKTIFELQTVDWTGSERLSSSELRETMRWLQSLGVRHLGYYPDDFIAGHPEFEELRLGMSLTDDFGEAGQ